jgi:DNA polymerase I
MKSLYLIDVMAMAFRNFHAFYQNPLKTSTGMPTSALFGSAQFLLNLIEKQKPDYLALVSDTKAATFRHKLYPQYKANRTEMPEDLSQQIPFLYEFFDHLRCPVIKQDGYEADDIIGSLARSYAKDDIECFIVSGDKDFTQLLNSNVKLYSPKKGGEVLITGVDEIVERFQCTPNQIIDILAIMGDAADNIPGVRGIGEKGAIKLVSEFGSLEQVYARIEEVRNNKQKEALLAARDMALLCKELVTIKTDIHPLPTLEELKLDIPATLTNPDLRGFLQRFEFRSLYERLNGKEIKVNAPASTCSYLCVNTSSVLEDFKRTLQDAAVIAFDSETTGIHVIKDRPIGLSFSTQSSRAFYLPLHDNSFADESLSFLREIFTDKDRSFVAHNAKFDLHMLSHLDLSIDGKIYDTMLASYLLQSTGKSHALDQCVYEEFKHNKIAITELIGEKKTGSMLEVPLETLTEYACEDADYTLRLYEVYRTKLKDKNLDTLFETVECPLVKILFKMEKLGFHIDTNALAELSLKLIAIEKEELGIIYDQAGEEFNVNSPKQLQRILFEKLKIHEILGIKNLKKTKSGFSTDVSVLEQLEAHPICAHILNFRSVMKLKGTYVDALPELSIKGRVHTSFHQSITATGRLSSSDPNLQNIPIRSELGKEIRRAFKAADKDHSILSADYSQVELRILAHMAEDENLRQAFWNGEDIHQATASKLFPPGTKDARAKAKAINFGIIYGMGPNRLSKQIGVSFQEAKQFIELYFERFPRIKTFIDQSIANARQTQETITLFGRRRPLPEIASERKLSQVNAENIAINSPIQGTAADIIKIAMIRVDEIIRLENLPVKMLLQVHDELVFELPTAFIDQAKGIIKEAMENAVQLSVPLVVDVGYGEDWLSAH